MIYTYIHSHDIFRSPTGRTYAVDPDLSDDGVRQDIILFTIIVFVESPTPLQNIKFISTIYLYSLSLNIRGELDYHLLSSCYCQVIK